MKFIAFRFFAHLISKFEFLISQTKQKICMKKIPSEKINEFFFEKAWTSKTEQSRHFRLPFSFYEQTQPRDLVPILFLFPQFYVKSITNFSLTQNTIPKYFLPLSINFYYFSHPFLPKMSSCVIHVKP